MIQYKASSWKKHEGKYQATVEQVLQVQNMKYDESKPNSSPYSLTLFLQCIDPDTGALFKHEQRYIWPLTGGGSLFDQLLSSLDIIPDLEEGNVKEEEIEGKMITVVFTQREYTAKDGSLRTADDITGIEKAAARKRPVNAVKAKKSDDDLPFN